MKKIINYILHQLLGFYQCLQEHGISYTMKRIIEHAGIDMGTRDFHRDDRKERINHENCNCHEVLSKVLGGTQNMERTVDDNFFFFDSDTLDSVHSFFLGYTIYQGKEYNSNKRDVESVPCDAWEGCFIEVKKMWIKLQSVRILMVVGEFIHLKKMDTLQCLIHSGFF